MENAEYRKKHVISIFKKIIFMIVCIIINYTSSIFKVERGGNEEAPQAYNLKVTRMNIRRGRRRGCQQSYMKKI